MSENIYSNTGDDLLTDLSVNLEPATHGKRFLNYLIDVIIFYIFLILLSMLILPFREIILEGSTLTKYLLIYAVFFLYYFISEASLKGRTIGKMITGSRAVNIDGSPITASTALTRTLCRLVPFEPLSCFGNAWHDRWSNTIVIDTKRSVLPS